MKKYKVFIVTAEPFNSEIISSLLWELDIKGINEVVNGLEVFVDEDSSISLNDVTGQLDKLKSEKMINSFTAEENIFDDKNWNEEWEKSVNIIEVTERIVIKPGFRDYKPKTDQVVITIDPKMSFGTGEHQSTKLMLYLIEKYIKQGMKVLDVGTGTGILSIAAIDFGADYAVAIDNDEWSFLNAVENIRVNRVNNKIDVRLCEIKDVHEKDFDFIFANIQKNVIISITDEIKNRMKPGGFTFLSGLLLTDEDDITRIYENSGFHKVEKIHLDDWTAFVFRI
jgi:ribosomal protein L11 methyltransferase